EKLNLQAHTHTHTHTHTGCQLWRGRGINHSCVTGNTENPSECPSTPDTHTDPHTHIGKYSKYTFISFNTFRNRTPSFQVFMWVLQTRITLWMSHVFNNITGVYIF
ncbi:hypothetical protein ILYODFUR_025789, partial [Ilyodon furcidens]